MLQPATPNAASSIAPDEPTDCAAAKAAAAPLQREAGQRDEIARPKRCAAGRAGRACQYERPMRRQPLDQDAKETADERRDQQRRPDRQDERGHPQSPPNGRPHLPRRTRLCSARKDHAVHATASVFAAFAAGLETLAGAHEAVVMERALTGGDGPYAPPQDPTRCTRFALTRATPAYAASVCAAATPSPDDAAVPLLRDRSCGQMRHGVLEAVSAAEVVARLQQQGSLPIRAELSTKGGVLAPLLNAEFLPRRGLSAQQVADLTRELATMLGAGQDLDRALRYAVETAPTRGWRACWAGCATRCATYPAVGGAGAGNRELHAAVRWHGPCRRGRRQTGRSPGAAG